LAARGNDTVRPPTRLAPSRWHPAFQPLGGGDDALAEDLTEPALQGDRDRRPDGSLIEPLDQRLEEPSMISRFACSPGSPWERR
jgi:hypothetical protein